jgi:quinol monooxygenase YgiN/mannose-6-phosphate isomerase-like protein (cupin superfamily)
MIVEYIRYALPDEGRRAGFEEAYAGAADALRASPHCESFELSRCAEDPSQYVLRIEWDSAEGHMQGFRRSDEFRRFFASVRPYVGDIAEMRHYEAVPRVAFRRADGAAQGAGDPGAGAGFATAGAGSCATLPLADALRAVPTADGVRFATLLRHGSLDVEVYAPRGRDDQTPHSRDEVYVVARGRAGFEGGGERWEVQASDLIFVPARADHRFVDLSDDFATWVMFYGPEGGERAG